MESTMKFKPGSYYIGDPVFVLFGDDLRMIFSQILHGKELRYGIKPLVSTKRFEGTKIVCEPYWIAKTPNLTGTLYSQDGKGWGFDWGMFGCVPYEFIDGQENFVVNKVDFPEEFECSSTDDVINIGHLQFTFNPPVK